MSSSGQERYTVCLSPSTMGIEASSDAVRPSVSNLLEQACAAGVQIECDLDRDEISIFVPSRGVVTRSTRHGQHA